MMSLPLFLYFLFCAYYLISLMENPETQVKNHERRPHEIEPLFLSGASLDRFQSTQSVLDNVMQALSDPNTHIIGVYGSNNAEIKHTLLHRLGKRIERHNLFNVVLTASASVTTNKNLCCFWQQGTNKADLINKIQDDIAGQLGVIFKDKSKDKRGSEVCDRIKNEQKVLVIVCDLYNGLDLEKVGIPFGANHRGCKILLTSTNVEVLSNHMHTQKNFKI